jgi:predicted transposase YbfD/YdcC
VLEDIKAAIASRFAEVEDPRTENRRHLLLDMIVIALCAVICGADDWVEVEQFGYAKEEWFRRFLALPHGIPSHDTFGRVFALLSPEQFERGFLSWVQAIAEVTRGQVIAVDGKTSRGSGDTYLGKRAIHMVSAWASQNRLVLGQRKVDGKSNEITAIPELLRLLDLSGCIVTLDAMGCQKEIAKQIVEQKGEYILALKENQSNLHQKVQKLMAEEKRDKGIHTPHDDAQTIEKGHGRLETRQCHALDVREWRFYLAPEGGWPNLRTAIRVRSRREINGACEKECRYFISSLPCDAPQLQQFIRDHWGVENGLHWVLDIAFREDDSRVRKGHGPQNLSVLRRLSLNLLRNDRQVKTGIKAKRRRAGWDEAYLLSILSV